MIDHILGRPSVTFRKYQVAVVCLFWTGYLLKGNRNGPPGAQRLSSFLSKRLTAWQTLVVTLLWLYVARNFGKLVNLECPEPLANMYSRSFFRATWVTTALDAGFWSAMNIRRKWLRDILSIVFSGYYLICAEQADEKVRKIRSVLTLDHLRVSWNKMTTPYMALASKVMRPRLMRYQPRAIRIPRPSTSAYSEPIQGWLYFDGPLSALKRQTKMVLNIPGGGFVAMSPRTHDDALIAWAGKTGLPVLSIDYRKAPEYPYPYALNECYDVYHSIFVSKGRCVGLSGEVMPQIVLCGDSAGGNLAAGVCLMILQTASTDTRRWLGEETLPTPAGLVLIYPALDVNIGNWMTDEQMALVRDRQTRSTNKRVISRKSAEFQRLTPRTPLPSDDEDEDDETKSTISKGKDSSLVKPPPPLKTRLATPSLISYFSDRVITPEMMRAMIILYIGPHNRPDFSTEYLLSPVLAPDALLAQFPKTYFMTGERDPLVDDTIIMAGRIRQAKAAMWRERYEMGLLNRRERARGFVEHDHVQVKLIEGISHGFIQFGNIFPEAWTYIFRVGRWFEEILTLAELKAFTPAATRGQASGISRAESSAAANGHTKHHHRRGTGASSADDEPLEMSSSFRFTKSSPSGKENGKGVVPKQPNGAQEYKHLVRDHKPDSIALPPRDDNAITADSQPTTPGTAAEEGFARNHPYRSHTRTRSRGGSSGRGKVRQNASMVSLATVGDDLLDRRMRGLVTGLAGGRDR